MKDYSEGFSKLTPHKEFDPRAFIGNKDISQELCSFILALALAHNDFKFYTMNFTMLLNAMPLGKPQRNSAWGEYAGIRLHLIRLHIGFVHELFELIKDNEKILQDSFFKKLIGSLPKNGQKSWNFLIEAALETKVSKKNPFVQIRNHIIFHYDKKMLLKGFKQGFFKGAGTIEDACISDGDALMNVRFYFADKAVEGYLGTNPEVLLNSLNPIIKNLNMALYLICTNFILKRDCPWRSPV